MKNKNTNQWTLEECVQHCLNGLKDPSTRGQVRTDDTFAIIEFGRWIRNTCGLWEHGTDRCVEDIIREFNAGRLKSRWLSENKITHPEITFDLNNAHQMQQPVECGLDHPDNCSAIIIEIVVERLNNGC